MTIKKSAAPAKKPAVKVQTIVVNKDAAAKAKFRGARGLWLDAITGYDGKPLADFIKAVNEAHPSTPNAGKLKDQLEPPMGWVRFFTRQEIVSVVSK